MTALVVARAADAVPPPGPVSASWGREDRRPVVGLTTHAEPSVTGGWDRPAMVLPLVYRDAVAAAGGAVVLLPPQQVDHPLAERLLSGLDALVLSGGEDVDPQRYGQEPHPSTDVPRVERDVWELLLLLHALRIGLPVLAVCRGVQLLNVALGGTLHQHLPDVVGHERHSPGPGRYGTTTVGVVAGTRLASILGEGGVDARCHHHQAVDEVAEGLVVSARAGDGTVEAVEMPGGAFVVGVQWHTEEDAHDRRLMTAFLAAARARGERSG